MEGIGDITLETRLTRLLGIRYPIVQGGMAWVAEHRLAAAVSEAGGLGIIAAANAPAHVVREEIRQARALTEKPFGVNIMLLSPHAGEVAAMVAEEGVKVVTTGAGNPEKFMGLFKDAGILVIPVVASVALAKRVARYGADAVVAEGMESGGHIGELTTMALVPQVADAVDVPVIAAGGIGDGRGLAAALMLGASGVQMGTRFVVAKESIVHENYKARVLSAKDIDTVVTGRSHGHPVRALRNQLTREYARMEAEGKSFEELETLTLGGLRRAVLEGDTKDGTVMAGQIAGLVDKEQTCKEMIEEIAAQAAGMLEKRQWM
ncbi:MAG: enoyl-[acyl-carrier-protein] reductase FabK [Lachnospiraceae bacterium]|jgi:enoyl-[acyl-carrier protein] reductase II|nr:enoyl-[acyl-carrier-protein] reductase FabK [Lachnospiraceae bacterium]